MRAVLSFTLTLALLISELPLTAEKASGYPASSIREAINREAGRRAREVPDANTEQSGEDTAGSGGWSRIRQLHPGRRVIVTTTDSQAVERYFLAVDDSGITLLNLGDQIPPAVRDVLRDVASQTPSRLINPQRRETFLLARNVRLEAGGVFAGDQKVADLAKIVQTIARAHLVELRHPSMSRHPIAKSVGIGMAIGFGGGFLLGASYGCNHCDDPGLAQMLGVFGLGIGAAGGLATGAVIAASHNAGNALIYRAP
jgi:hypothetical protein